VPPAWSSQLAPDTNNEADPDGDIYGRVVVLTGTLLTMTRQMAWERIAALGGVPEYSVTKRTNVLVVGGIIPAVLAPDHGDAPP
jgi:DNA polymerase-3 subunit epsilon